MADNNQLMPVLDGNLRSHYVRMPIQAQAASGIRILGRTIRSIVYTTDIAIIRNCDADAVFAVYPFTPQQVIAKAIVEASSIPVIIGVGGGTTAGSRSALLAKDAEAEGAYGVVINAPASNVTVEMVSRVVDIPVIATVIDGDVQTVRNRLESGASIINVAGGRNTIRFVRALRNEFPDIPIIATGGKTPESIEDTAVAGANAVICTPPTNAELFSPMMERYRNATIDHHDATKPIRPLSAAAASEIEDGVRYLVSQGLLPETES